MRYILFVNVVEDINSYHHFCILREDFRQDVKHSEKFSLLE
jgi:hypothetical protein